MNEITSLDELFEEVKEHLEVAPARTEKKRTKERAVASGNTELFLSPDNWNRGKNVALVCKGSRKLLGVFAEWMHKSVEGVRRLVRDESGLPIHEVEEVEGDWEPKGKLEHKGTTRETRVVPFPLELAGFLICEEETELEVTLAEGYILGVYLYKGLSFFGAAGTILQLPAGTAVLPLMTHQSKVALRKELNLCLTN